MKFLIVTFALLASAYADVSELGYNYEKPIVAASAPVAVQPEKSYIPPAAPAPVPAPSAPAKSYIPPAAAQASAPIPAPAPVAAPAPVQIAAPAAPVSTYIPPAPKVEEPVSSYIPPAPIAAAASEEIEKTPSSGYRYKTVRRVVYRRRY